VDALPIEIFRGLLNIIDQSGRTTYRHKHVRSFRRENQTFRNPRLDHLDVRGVLFHQKRPHIVLRYVNGGRKNQGRSHLSSGQLARCGSDA